MRNWSHPRCAGVAGRGADAIWGALGLRSEVARSEGRPLAGFSADLWKFFDLVNPQAAIQLLEAVGLDEGVACALKSFYAELGRIMTLNGVAGKKWFAHQSVLQGCAWSNPLTVVLGTLWAYFVEHSAQVAAYTYADDWYVMADRFSLEPEAEPAAANELYVPPAEEGEGAVGPGA